MTYQTLLLDKADRVATITLNRPKKRNAMNPAMHEEMAHVLEALRYDSEVKVVVITGAGNSFCAGMDLKEFFTDLKETPDEYDRITRIAVEWRGRTLRYYPKPTIAMINGYCFGGAFSIVEGCDLAIAAEEATFGLSEINFKLFPGGSVSKSLANLMRPRDALWYGMTGEPFNGVVAAQIGFVNKAVPLARLHEEARKVALTIAQKDPWALKATKDGYHHSLGMGWDAAIDYASAKEMELVLRQGDAFRKEGIGDFLKGNYRPGLESHGAAR
ncbi:MAG TPA: p-hydroxycinnamoyl CoA hydratase/lyase [Xanthobacteraceae bacterium]|nr:p-hydroxycinnamoyl CoA hydratase/lyase [Xanthobacteraceae bacterium]